MISIIPESSAIGHYSHRPPHLYSTQSTRSTEEQNVAVRIANLEAAKTIVDIFQRHAEGCSTIGKSIGKFRAERIEHKV